MANGGEGMHGNNASADRQNATTNGQDGAVDGDAEADGEAGPTRGQPREKASRTMHDVDPTVTTYVEPIAFPSILGLAGFAGSTWIGSMFLAQWWGDVHSFAIFAPFTALWGGFGQFIAGYFGYYSKNILVTVVHVLWGSWWISFGLLAAFVVRARG